MSAISKTIETRDLSIYYGQKKAINNVSVSIYENQITALVGPSGCGKTSFINCLNRLTDLIPACRVDGEIIIGGVNILDKRTDLIALRRQVGMIFQRPNPFPISIRRNIDLPLREYGMKDRDARAETIRSALAAVGLWEEVSDRLDDSALSLSGGQQQRLCVARTIALRPEIILFDEPCSALDPISSGIVEDLITQLSRQYTVVIITHNLAQARRIADHVGFFWFKDGSGHLIEFGTVKQIFDEPKEDFTKAYVTGSKG